MVKQRSMRRHRSRSRSAGKSRARSMRRSRSISRSRGMRGGKLSGDSSYSTLIAGSSDNSTNLTSQSGDFQQNVDRNTSNISGEGNNVNMSQFKGLIPPGAYYGGKTHRKSRMRGGDGEVVGAESESAIETNPSTAMSGGKRRRRRMRGGMGSVSDDSEAAKYDMMEASTEAANKGMLGTQDGGRRRRRRMRGGDDMTAMNPDKAPLDGGMYDPPMGPGSTPTSGGTRRKRRGGGVIATAALPFGLFGLQKYFQGRKPEHGTSRHSRRRHRRS